VVLGVSDDCPGVEALPGYLKKFFIPAREDPMYVPLNFNLDARRTGRFLVTVMLVLLAAHVLAMQANFNDGLGLKEALGFEYWQVAIFDLDEEESFGTWFSSANLLFASLLFFYQARLRRRQLDRMHYWWFALGIGFCLMSVDEVVGMHELINTIFDESVWAGLSLGLVAGAFLGFIPFLWHYRWRTSGLFIFAGILFTGGAVGVEQLSGSDVNSLQYNMLTCLEEGLEMSGVILAIYTVLQLMGAEDSAPG
jgi:hypothetical protein